MAHARNLEKQPSEFEELIPIVVYSRFSSDNQREESIDAQVRAAKEYAKQKGFRIVKLYADRAKSGKTADRPDFIQMITDSATGDFKYVLVHKLDRFSRNKYDSVIYKKKLEQNGVKVLSVVENLDGSPESMMMETVIEGFSQYYVENLKREVMKGMKENAHQAKHNGGKPPIGYDVDAEKKYIINEDEAVAVKLIFNMYVKGHPYNEIVRTLNEKGYTTKVGKSFAKNSIYGIVTNEKYTGVYIFNKRSSEDVFARRNNHKYKDDSETIRIEGGMPEIISKETFEEAKAIINSRKRSKGQNTAISNYLLSGLITCGVCGSAMTGNRRKSGKGNLFESYRCSGKLRKFTECDGKEIKKDAIEDYILYELEKAILNPKNTKKLVKQINESIEEHNKTNNSEVKPLKIKISGVDNKIRNIISAIENGLDDEMMYQRIKELKDQKLIFENQLLEINSDEVLKSVEESEVRELFKEFRTELKDKKSFGTKRILKEFVKEVFVYKDHVEVTFNVVFSLVKAYSNVYLIKVIYKF